VRTYEERTRELHRRIDALKTAKQLRRFRITCAAAFAVSLAAVILAAAGVSQMVFQAPDPSLEGIAASIFAGHEHLKYVVIAVISLCLGILVTVFCFRLKKQMNEQKYDSRKH